MGTKTTSNKVIVETILTTGMTHASATTMFHVSERWIRELMRRYRTAGLTGLEPQSRRPHTTPHATPQARTDHILALRDHLHTTGNDAGAD